MVAEAAEGCGGGRGQQHHYLLVDSGWDLVI